MAKLEGVPCKGVNGVLTKETYATVEAGSTPRAVSCCHVNRIEGIDESSSGNARYVFIICKAALVGMRLNGMSVEEVKRYRCIHAYPARW